MYTQYAESSSHNIATTQNIRRTTENKRKRDRERSPSPPPSPRVASPLPKSVLTGVSLTCSSLKVFKETPRAPQMLYSGVTILIDGTFSPKSNPNFICCSLIPLLLSYASGCEQRFITFAASFTFWEIITVSSPALSNQAQFSPSR